MSRMLEYYGEDDAIVKAVSDDRYYATVDPHKCSGVRTFWFVLPYQPVLFNSRLQRAVKEFSDAHSFAIEQSLQQPTYIKIAWKNVGKPLMQEAIALQADIRGRTVGSA